jgi:hypothetical protein
MAAEPGIRYEYRIVGGSSRGPPEKGSTSRLPSLQENWPGGRQDTLDNTRLAVLADALQDAGSENLEILAHLREPGAIHVRGCFLLDLLLGKE